MSDGIAIPKLEGEKELNGAPKDVALMEAAEDLEDQFVAILAGGRMTDFELGAFRRRLRGNVTLLADYTEERAVIRALDRRGIDSEWAHRVLVSRMRRKEGDDPQAA